MSDLAFSGTAVVGPAFRSAVVGGGLSVAMNWNKVLRWISVGLIVAVLILFGRMSTDLVGDQALLNSASQVKYTSGNASSLDDGQYWDLKSLRPPLPCTTLTSRSDHFNAPC